MGEISGDRFFELEVASREQLLKWLDHNHSRKEGIWLITFKKVERAKYISTDEVLDSLVAYGWTDGIRRKLDDTRTRQFVSPRRTQPWAQSYKDRAERLISEGLMATPGQASIDLAKASGMWEDMQSVDQLLIPHDLEIALAQSMNARQNFDSFPPSTRRNILRWIHSAKANETREKRVLTVATDSQRGIRTRSNG